MAFLQSELHLGEGQRKRIHVNQHVLRANKKLRKADPKAELAPPITIRTTRNIYYAYSVSLDGASEVVYDEGHPLNCGARVWVETFGAVHALCGDSLP